MDELRFATEIEADVFEIDCCWSGVVRGIERYAAYQPPGLGHELAKWADLLDGIRALREPD